MKILKQIGTHKALKVNGRIGIYLKGITIDELVFEDELLYTIPLENKDDLESIFDRLDETNRILRTEANAELN